MNILPKKSWHVRNKDNVARVRRDEQQAATEEREVRRRVALAEQEARTDFLRRKSRQSLPESGRESLAPTPSDGASQNLNLFRDLEGGKRQKIGSKEYEAEKRQEKEKQERAIGLLTYLGQSSAEAQTSKPWYQEAPGSKADAGGEKDARLKRQMDPLLAMNQFLRRAGRPQRRRASGGGPGGRGEPPTAERLRAERLRREQAERARAELLLAGEGEGEREGARGETEADDRKRRYNSQFHPHLSRGPRSGNAR
ncbi:leukocyte receptor cluster member 1-like [Heptranchias perlo]|uniref:leukocyte receptor cluster member 1-like n=1 Tax=Heptranchias perlo TaxID=212740 RepID=UPI003559BD60